MNKARITYRFDTNGSRLEKKDKPREPDSGQAVIPLHPADYRVAETEGKKAGGLALTDLEEPEEYGAAAYRRPTAGRIRDDYYLDPLRTDHGAWASSLAQETERLEKIIKQSDRFASDRSGGSDPAWAGEPVDDGAPDRSVPRWDERDFEPESGYARAYLAPPVRRRPTSWLKIVSSVGGAVATGVLFGYLALGLFHASDGGTPRSAEPVSTGSQDAGAVGGAGQPSGPDQAAAGADADAGASAGNVPAGTVSVNLPAETHYMLQNGVFSNRDGADKAESALRKVGFAAADADLGAITVFAGMTGDRSDALLLGQRLKDSGMDVYIKSFVVPETALISWKGTSGADAKSFLAGARGLVRTLEDLTVLHLKEQQPSAMDASAVEQLHKQHQAWMEGLPAVNRDAPETAAVPLKAMVGAINAAIVAMDEYNKNPSEAALWQVQTHLMDALLGEKLLLDTIGKA